MKARRKKPSARGTAATKPAAPRKLAAIATALEADCTIENAPGLQKRLVKSLADRACVTLDLAAVKRCDTAGMQVLAAFIRERRGAGRKVALTGMSDNFLVIVKLLGLNALFDPVPDDTQAGHA